MKRFGYIIVSRPPLFLPVYLAEGVVSWVRLPPSTPAAADSPPMTSLALNRLSGLSHLGR